MHSNTVCILHSDCDSKVHIILFNTHPLPVDTFLPHVAQLVI